MIVDDHELVRNGISSMLSATDDLHLVAEAETAADAVRAAERERPDVIVMDIRLLEGSGIEATREIRARLPETQVLMVTSFADDEALYASIMAGAAGYVLKQIRGGELLRAIRALGSGQSLLDPAVTRAVLERLRRGKHLLKDEKLARLSPQEEKILALVANGKTKRRDWHRDVPRRENREELCLQHPGKAGSRASCRGRGLPRASLERADFLS